eukprot:3871320-Heterocapsa_arctica.AAC.1
MNKEKVTNRNKDIKKRPAKEEETSHGDTMESSTLEEWWKNPQMVLAALEKDKEDQKARDLLLEYHVQDRTDTDRMRMELEMYEPVQIYKELQDIEENIRKNKDQAFTIMDDE